MQSPLHSYVCALSPRVCVCQGARESSFTFFFTWWSVLQENVTFPSNFSSMTDYVLPLETRCSSSLYAPSMQMSGKDTKRVTFEALFIKSDFSRLGVKEVLMFSNELQAKSVQCIGKNLNFGVRHI